MFQSKEQAHYWSLIMREYYHRWRCANMKPLMHSFLRNVRMLRGIDILNIILETPRPFGRRTRVVLEPSFLRYQSPLECGEAMLCGLTYATDKHMVAVYRSLDGHYIYYDPSDEPPHDAFHVYCWRNNIPQHCVKMVCKEIQDPKFNTCTYHSLTFLDFATRCDDGNVYSVIMRFRRHMRLEAELKAVTTVGDIIGELHRGMCLRTNHWCESIVK